MSHIGHVNQYFGVFLMLILCVCIFFGLVYLASKIGNNLAKKDRKRLSLSQYECGPTPVKQSNKINSMFFIFVIIFILFDVEIVFMFPWAVMFKYLGWFGLFEMISFIFMIFVGFIYAYKKGAFKWQSIN